MHENESFNERKVEIFEESATDANDLLILKRVGEIQEAPESLAKKKHEAQINMKRMREIKKIQLKKMQLPSAQAPKIQVKRIQELTQPQVKKLRVLSQGEIDIMHERPQQDRLKKIRVLSQSQLNKIQDHTQPNIKNFEIEPESDVLRKRPEHSRPQMKRLQQLTQSEMRKIRALQQSKKTPETLELEMQNIRDVEDSLRREDQASLSDNMNFSIEGLLEPNQIDSERCQNFGKLMNDTIGYFDQVIKELDTTLLNKSKVSITYFYLVFLRFLIGDPTL